MSRKLPARHAAGPQPGAAEEPLGDLIPTGTECWSVYTYIYIYDYVLYLRCIALSTYTFTHMFYIYVYFLMLIVLFIT